MRYRIMLALILLALNDPKEAAHPLLLEHSRLVMTTGGWREFQTTVGHYFWWDHNHILVFTGDENQRLIDVGTHLSTPQPSKIPFFRDSLSSNNRFEIESDSVGDELMWKVVDVSSRSTLGSWKSPRQVPAPVGRNDFFLPWQPQVFWASNGQSLYEAEYKFFGRKQRLQVRHRALDNLSEPKVYPNIFVDQPAVIHDEEAFTWTKQNTQTFLITSWRLDNPSKARRQKVRSPKGGIFIDFQPSPDYRRALWLVGTPVKERMKDMAYPYNSISLWTSDLRGENMREVGRIPFKTNDIIQAQDRYQHFGELHWNPDSKRISFIYDGKFYIVNAD